jgi:acetolactate synthase small subunit
MPHKEAYTYTVILTVRHPQNVLTRCSQIMSRRGHTITTLTTIKNMMTITASGHESNVSNVIAQLQTLVDVIEINHYGELDNE